MVVGRLSCGGGTNHVHCHLDTLEYYPPASRVGAVNLAIRSATLFVSVEIYECGTGSMWCWMTAFANIVVVAVALLFDRLDYPRQPVPSVL